MAYYNKGILALLITFLMAISIASATQIPLYQANKVDVSISTANNIQGVSTSTCASIDNTCAEYNSNPGIYKNCVPNTEATLCHCEFWGCGTGTTCTTGEIKCQGSSYADSVSCPYPGQKTAYCLSGVCNYESRCGAMPECSKINGKGYIKDGVTGSLSNCQATSDPLVCDCTFSEINSPVYIEGETADTSPAISPIVNKQCLQEQNKVQVSLSFWDKILIGLGFKDYPVDVDTSGFYGTNPGNCYDGAVYCPGVSGCTSCCYRGCDVPNPLTPPQQVTTYPKCLGSSVQCYQCSTSGYYGTWGDDGIYHCCQSAYPYFYDGLCHKSPPTTCTDECQTDSCSGTTYYECYDNDADGCNEKNSVPLNFNNFPCSSGNVVATGSVTKLCKSGIMFELSCMGSTISCSANNCPSNTCSSSTACGTSCTDTCASKGYNCGVATICGSQTNCGECYNGQVCQSNKCVAGQTHKVCQNSQCVSVSGSGADECTSNSNCQSTHLECKDNMCQAVAGVGANSCSTNEDCSSTHLVCVGGVCIKTDGAGTNECSPQGVTCGGGQTHKACVNNACTTVSGSGADSCSSNADCTSPACTVGATQTCSVTSNGKLCAGKQTCVAGTNGNTWGNCVKDDQSCGRGDLWIYIVIIGGIVFVCGIMIYLAYGGRRK